MVEMERAGFTIREMEGVCSPGAETRRKEKRDVSSCFEPKEPSGAVCSLRVAGQDGRKNLDHSRILVFPGIVVA